MEWPVRPAKDARAWGRIKCPKCGAKRGAACVGVSAGNPKWLAWFASWQGCHTERRDAARGYRIVRTVRKVPV
jgi:hypothetical protein